MGLEVFDKYECEGQMTLFDDAEIEMPERVFAVSKIFARARKQMSVNEYKTFAMALSNVDFTKEMPEVVYLDKKQLARICGVNSDADHLSINLYRAIKDLPRNSHLEFKDEDLKFYDSGVFVTRVTMLKNRVKIKFEKDYLSLFGNLQKDYITMWSLDVFKMQGTRTMAFYEYLRLHCDTREDINSVGLGVKAIKELFGMSIEDYTKVVDGKVKFDRYNFEKYVIDPLCKDMESCRMIQLIKLENGKHYEKVKRNGRVLGYKFYFRISDRPQIASAEEMDILKRDIEKNPKILKIAKDIADGKKRPSKKKDSFNNFTQREYDFEELEKEFLI